MMDDDCLVVSCVAPSVSSSEPVSAVTAKCVLINDNAPSLQSSAAHEQQ